MDNQIGLLMTNLRHPSLQVKKHDQTRGIWQARVDRRYRVYFQIEADTYVLLAVVPHPK